MSYKPINILDDFGTLFHSSLEAAAIAKQYASSYKSWFNAYTIVSGN